MILGGLVLLPAGTGEEPAGFSCALRVAPDGSLHYSPVNFSLPDISAGVKLDLGRGLYCNILNNSGRVIPAETVRSLDENFTLYIWPNDTAAFGTPPYAKINIIIVTRDGMGGVAGYFSSSDPDAIYLDYDDLGLDLDVTAHEFEHLIHNSLDPGETVWLNEGCAETGIYVCFGGGRPGLVQHFQAYGFDTDNDFTAWNTVSDYGGAGLWTIYCHEHFGGNDFTKALVADSARGVQSYNNRLAFKSESFSSVFKKWAVANWLNNATVDAGEWGYSGVWNCVGHTFIFNQYPMTCSSAVSQANGADYIRFEPTAWNHNGGDLELNVTFASGTGYCALAMVGRAPVPDAVSVPVITGNKATILVPNLGGDYSVAGLVLSGLAGPCSYSFTANVVDLTAPNTSFWVSPQRPDGKNGWYRSLPTVSLGVNENASIYYHWDNGTDSKYSGPFKAPEGRHNLSFHSVDRVGNVELEKRRELLVDTAPPNTSCNISPAGPDGENGWYRSPAEITLLCDTPEANLTSGWDEEPLKRYGGPVQLREGIHRLNWHAEDEAGNLEPLRSVITKLDSEAPTVDFNLTPSTPDGQNGWYLKPPTIYLSCADPGNPAIYYSWDGGNETRYTRELRAANGRHTLRFFAVDEAGNRGAPSSLVVKLDPGAPTVTASTGIPVPDGLNGWFRTETNLTISTDESGNATIYFMWDEGTERVYDGPLPVPEGEHSITCFAIDEAGNRGKELTMQFRMDSIPPVSQLEIMPEDIGNGWYHERPRLTLRTEPGATMMYSLDNATYKKYTRPVEIGEGISYLTYYATDYAGNNETRSVRRFRVDTVAPLLVVNLSVLRVLTGEQVNITATASDQNGIQDYLFDFGDGTTSAWTRFGNYSRTYGTPGNYTIRVKVRDGAGLETISEPSSLNVSLPPKRYVPPPPSVADYIRSIPVYLYYILAVVFAAAIAGLGARKALKYSRRKRLYLEVERAEEERERRHTREVDEDVAAGYFGGRTPTVPFHGGAGMFRGAPGQGAFRGPGDTRTDGEPAGDGSSGRSGSHAVPPVPEPGYPAPPHQSATPEGTPELQEEQTAPSFEGVKVIHARQEEVVYVSKMGDSKPIWARAKDKPSAPAGPSVELARLPPGAVTSREQPVPAVNHDGDRDELVQRLNRDNT